MIRANEVFELLVAFLFFPFIVRSLSATYTPFRRWLLAALVALFASYVFTITEGIIAENVFNTLEHASVAVSAICFLGAAYVGLRRWQVRQGGEGQ